jgi:hypothetical protein
MQRSIYELSSGGFIGEWLASYLQSIRQAELGVIFGLIGDRIGRKNVLLTTFLLMSFEALRERQEAENVVNHATPRSSIGLHLGTVFRL